MGEAAEKESQQTRAKGAAGDEEEPVGERDYVQIRGIHGEHTETGGDKESENMMTEVETGISNDVA